VIVLSFQTTIHDLRLWLTGSVRLFIRSSTPPPVERVDASARFAGHIFPMQQVRRMKRARVVQRRCCRGHERTEARGAPCGILEFIELKLFVSLAATFRNGNVAHESAARLSRSTAGLGLQLSFRASARLSRDSAVIAAMAARSGAQSDFSK
jgi:hypothetical protein